MILVPLAGDGLDRIALTAAFDLARRFDAHVEGIFIRPDLYEMFADVGLMPAPDVVDRLYRDTAAELERRRLAAESAFDAVRTETGSTEAETPPTSAQSSAYWRDLSGVRDYLIGLEGRYADLVVFSRDAVDIDRQIRRTFERTLMGTGRPLLSIAPSAPERYGETVAIAWDGSVAASRAVASALPLLHLAKRVHALSVEAPPTRIDDLDRLRAYLAWHGIRCERRGIAPEQVEVGAELLSASKEHDVTLLVMGGYGHRPKQDLTFGSATQYVLRCADPALSVFMAH